MKIGGILPISLLMGLLTHVFLYSEKDKLLDYVCQPTVRAFLDTIAYAEGTLNEDGYRIIFGFVLFDNFHDHPRKKICVNSQGRRLCSTAAGKYQISQKTWDWLAPRIQAKDFTPLNQDRAAIQLLIDKGALACLYEENLALAVDKVKNIWASLPGSKYQQPTKSQKELKKVYNERLKYYKKKKITLKQLTQQLGYV